MIIELRLCVVKLFARMVCTQISPLRADTRKARVSNLQMVGPAR